ncbi:response regulator transcription factor [Leptolyngbya sp. FACHB-261]|uniref:response regulator transcription factor n=1 Tax=Leptolyngbya sp. FACHB-261 TaxID=2692806 RepID=UPI001683EDFC|nr:response regulator transcription factor [Leptolyngbya sp. FACHB-261]MBD2104624.1 response regulator transcription factor [Leptolyngbya sp. FACHB-261]
MLTILIASDRSPWNQKTRIWLHEHNWQTIMQTNAKLAWQLLLSGKAQVLIADVECLEPFDGYSLAERCRQVDFLQDLPILLVGPDLSIPRVVELLTRADDYLRLPIDPAELEARIRVAIRRSSRLRPVGPNLRLDAISSTVQIRDQTPVLLSALEFRLLSVLLEAQGMPLTSSQLAERIWEHPRPAQLDQLRVHIYHLRRKLENEPSQPLLIRHLRDQGYILNLQADLLQSRSA